MITAIQSQWNLITEYELGQILDTIVDQVDTILSANGGNTKY